MPGQQIHANQANEQKPPPLSLKVILMIEGDSDFGKSCKRAIQTGTPYHVLLARDGDIAWKTLHHIQADLLLLTHQPPHMQGLQIYDRLHALEGMANIPAILIEGASSIPPQEVARRHLTLIKRPLVLSTLIDTIDKLFAETDEKLLFTDFHSDNLYPDANGLTC